jgi:tetratricopeptide (TPR) repeat protein
VYLHWEGEGVPFTKKVKINRNQSTEHALKSFAAAYLKAEGGNLEAGNLSVHTTDGTSVTVWGDSVGSRDDFYVKESQPHSRAAPQPPDATGERLPIKKSNAKQADKKTDAKQADKKISSAAESLIRSYLGEAEKLKEAKKYRESRLAYERVLKISEDHIGALEGIGDVYSLTRRSSKAVEYFARAAAISSGVRLRIKLGESYLETLQFAEAIEILGGIPRESVSKRERNDLEVYLARAMLELGQGQESANMVQEVG